MPAVGAQQAAHHLERGRLAGAVGAEQAEDLAAADAEADVVGGGEVAEPLGQPVGLDDRRLPAPRDVRCAAPAASRSSGRRPAGRRTRPRSAAGSATDLRGQAHQGSSGRAARSVRDDQPDAAALDDAVDDARAAAWPRRAPAPRPLGSAGPGSSGPRRAAVSSSGGPS